MQGVCANVWMKIMIRIRIRIRIWEEIEMGIWGETERSDACQVVY